MAKVPDKSRERRWRELVARQRRSGQSVRAFCRSEELAESAFHFWRRELRQGPARPALLPLTLTAASPRAPLELELPGGAVLRIGAEAPKLLPKHPLRQAMDYTLGNGPALARYPEQGYLTIDNNPAENEIRRIALGRKNWLHCGSDRGGRAAAVHYSLIASCQRHDVDPWAYLRDLLTWLPVIQAAPSGTFPEDALRQLLPDRWKPTR